MKLLFDQNISYKIVKKILNIFPNSDQVRQLGLEDAKDIEIWNYSKDNGYTIVTFDADFFDFSIIKGTPPKVIWLRTGNTSTKNIEQLLIAKSDYIREFCESDDMTKVGCLELIE